MPMLMDSSKPMLSAPLYLYGAISDKYNGTDCESVEIGNRMVSPRHNLAVSNWQWKDILKKDEKYNFTLEKLGGSCSNILHN